MNKKLLFIMVVSMLVMLLVGCNTLYSITVEVNGNGTATADVASASEGRTVTLTVTPEEGYELKSISVNGEEIEGTSFVMPAENVTIVVEFAEQIKVYTVVFKNWDGTILKTEEVEEGKAATAPETPVREADEDNTYEFIGWSEDFSNVTSDMGIIAQFEAKPILKHTVTLVFNNGDENLEYVVTNGMLFEEPETPERRGYEFVKWYKDEALIEEYDFNEPVTEDLTLYAAWERYVITPATSFDSGSGTEEDPFIIMTAGQLAYINEFIEAGNDGYYYYKLGRDIDLNYAEWTPIGRFNGILSQQFSFYGVFDGCNYKVSNMMITENNQLNIGLFGITNNYEFSGGNITVSFIKNLHVENARIDITLDANKEYLDWVNIGALIGNLGGSCLLNCTADGDIKIYNQGISMLLNVGGMYGIDFCNSSSKYSVERCVSEVNIYYFAVGKTNTINIGGFAGYPESPTIRDCYSAGVFNIDFLFEEKQNINNVNIAGFTANSMATIYTSYTVAQINVNCENVNFDRNSVRFGGFSGLGEDGYYSWCGVLGGHFDLQGIEENNIFLADKFVAARAYGNSENFVYDGYKMTGFAEECFGQNSSALNKNLYQEYSAEQLNSKEFYLNISWDETIWNLENLDIANGVYPTLKPTLY